MADFSLDFPFAHGDPLGSADFRTEPEDFVVDETLGFRPSGEGEHLFLHIRKRNRNTRWVAEQLAHLAGVSTMDVGYCGMKDRRAVTSQWFSLYLPKRVPKRELDVTMVAAIEGVELLASARHNRKLRRGEHQSNTFKIRLRNCTAQQLELEPRLSAIAESGVPNYFGEQRFGHGGNNLREFEKLFVGQRGDTRARNRQRGRNRKGGKGVANRGSDTGIYLSAGRSYLYNRILAMRVEQESWNQLLPGEDAATGALWGRGRNQRSEQLIALERQVAAQLPGWCDALEHSGMSQERRALVLLPEQFCWNFDGADLTLDFRLAPGCFATSILRELTTLQSARDIVPPLSSAAIKNQE